MVSRAHRSPSISYRCRALFAVGALLVALPALSTSRKPPAPLSPPPSTQQLEAIATLVAHWQHQPASASRDTLERALVPLLQHVAAPHHIRDDETALTSIVDALQVRGVDARWLVEADRVRRAEATRKSCKDRQAEARIMLQAVAREARGFGASVEDLRALVAEHTVRRPRDLARYRFDVDSSDAGFRATATGIGEMAGDAWLATAATGPVATNDLCATLVVARVATSPQPTAAGGVAPDDEAVLGAVATLSRTIDADAAADERALVALSQIALQQIGIDSWQAERHLDEPRLEQLVDSVKARGGSLGAIVAPTLLSVCNDAHAQARAHLNALHEQRDDDEQTITSLPQHYTFTERGAGSTLRLTLTGTGLMRGDVVTITAADHEAGDLRGPAKSDFCAKKAAALRRR